MKKTLLALAAASVCASSAQAYTVYDNQDSGTKIDFSGSVRLKWESTSEKTRDFTQGTVEREHTNHAVDNNGSRFGFKINQQLGNGFYALGAMQFRFNNSNNHQHNFGRLYTREAYAGIGHKAYGELTHGNMTVITDEVKRTDYPNTNSLSDGLLEYSARKVTQYVYKGVEGLKVGAFYGAKNERELNGDKVGNHRKGVWGLGAIYKYDISELQSVKFGLGFSRERFNQHRRNVESETAYAVDTAYTYDKTTVGLDLERRVTKNFAGNKRTENEVRTLVFQEVTPDLNAYAMYAFRHNKANDHSSKTKSSEFMFGAEYYVYQQGTLKVKPFVEWKTVEKRAYNSAGVKTQKSRDNTTIIGLRAYW